MLYANAHCHPQFHDLTRQEEIIRSWSGYPIVMSGTTLSDARTLIDLHQKFPFALPTLGWHPWEIPNGISPKYTQQQLRHWTTLLEDNPFPIGEVGLDFHPRWRNTATDQLNILRYFFQIASDLKRPMILHVVKAHHEVLRLLKQFPTVRIYLHQFTGSFEVYAQYYKYDVYFGVPIVHWSPRWNRLIHKVDVRRLLLETDSAIPRFEFQQWMDLRQVSKEVAIGSYNNLFQFLQGTSDDFAHQFQNSM